MKELDELFTPEKVQRDERLSHMPETKLIRSNDSDYTPLWHIGVRQFSRYFRSNLIASVSYVTKCNHKQLGGCWGYSMESDTEKLRADLSHKCSRCFK